jgi:type II secretory pathway pseudopilin PulG
MALLLAVAVLGIGLLAASEVWVTTVRRQKLDELDWIGAQFKQAIGSYYAATPGSAMTYPSNLGELLEDRRLLVIKRHLRVIYLNPFTGKPDWELVVGPGGRLRGVRARIPTDSGVEVREFIHMSA